jgi:hypothetical protein
MIAHAWFRRQLGGVVAEVLPGGDGQCRRERPRIRDEIGT